MAFSEQAWNDFEYLKNTLDYYCNAEATNSLKDGLVKLETNVNVILADPARTAELAALADTHYHCTSAHMLSVYQRLMELKADLIAHGF